MKPFLFSLCLLIACHAIAQDPVAVANKCYTDKNYDCATEQYKKVISEKKYQDKDYANILYRIGYGLAQMQRNEEAIRYFKDATATKPDMGDAYWSLGWVYARMDNDELAAENYSKAIGYLKDDTKSLKTLYYARADCYYALNKDSLALLDYLIGIKLDSTGSDNYVGAANAAYGMKRYNDAVAWYQKSIQMGDTSKKVMAARYYLLGQSYYKQLKYDQSIAPYLKALEMDPAYGSAQWGIAAAYYNQNKWVEAAKEYGKAIPMYKNDTASLKQLYYLRGKSYNSNKEFAKAMTDLDASLKINSNYRQAVWERASVNYQQKKYKEAIPDYTKAITLYEGSENDLDDLYNYRGYCYLKIKDTAKAKDDFTESLDYNYSTTSANTQMGNISFAEKNYTAAREHYSYGISDHTADSAEFARIYFRKGFSNIYSGTNYLYVGKDDLLQSIKYDSTNKEAHRYLADVYYTQKYYSSAENELDKCIRLYKNVKDSLPVMYIYRALARWQQKEYKDALTDYEQADKLKKITDAEKVKSMGQLAFEVKEYDKATTYFTRVIPMYKTEQKNDLMFAYFARGRTSLELKKKDPAVADLKKALELAPGNAEIQTWLTKAQAL